MHGVAVQTATERNLRNGNVGQQTAITLPPVPRPTSPWQVHLAPELVKRLLFAHLLTMQKAQGRPLRRNPNAIKSVMMRELSSTDEYESTDEHGTDVSPMDDVVQQQLVSHSRHLDQTQVMHDHHDFSHRMRSR